MSEKKVDEPVDTAGDDAAGDDNEEKKEGKSQLPSKSYFTFIASLALCGFSGLSGAIAFIGGLGLKGLISLIHAAHGGCLSPYMAQLEFRLWKLGDITDALDDIKGTIGGLSTFNDELEGNVNDLKKEVGKMGEVEAKLSGLAEEQGQDVNQLKELVGEYAKINREMKKALIARRQERLVEYVLESDTDGSFSIGEQELDILVMNLCHSEELIFNVEKFRKEVTKKDGSVLVIMNLLKKIVREQPDEGPILDDDSIGKDADVKIDIIEVDKVPLEGVKNQDGEGNDNDSRSKDTIDGIRKRDNDASTVGSLMSATSFYDC